MPITNAVAVGSGSGIQGQRTGTDGSRRSSLTGEEYVYSPRIDAAVGPFTTGSTRHRPVFDELLTAHRTFVDRLVESHRENVRRLRGTDAVPSLDSIAARKSNAGRCPARVRHGRIVRARQYVRENNELWELSVRR